MNLLTSKRSKGVGDLLDRSSPAVCGAFEREIIVRNSNVSTTKARLKQAGFSIVGTSEPGLSTKKIWFIRGGLAGL